MLDDFQKQMSTASGLDELMDALEATVRDMGFAGFVYWTHLRKPFDELRGSETFYLSRGPAHLKAFESLYFSRRMYQEDPAARMAAEHFEPFSSRSARSAMPTSRRRRWLYALEQRFGFRYDINIPIHTPLRVQVLNAYCIGNDEALGEMIERETPALCNIAAAFAASVVDFVILDGTDDSADIMLSRRQQEVLAWMAKGRSNREIAGILECSEATVKFHVSGLLERLNAANRAEAIAIAARQGWIMN